VSLVPTGLPEGGEGGEIDGKGGADGQHGASLDKA